MTHRVRPGPAIGAAVDLRAGNSVIRREEVLQRLGDRSGGSVGDAVQFAAIARREHDRLLENSLPAQLGGGLQRLLLRECDALAQLNRRGAMIAPDQHDVDTPASAALGAAGSPGLRIGRRGHQ